MPAAIASTSALHKREPLPAAAKGKGKARAAPPFQEDDERARKRARLAVKKSNRPRADASSASSSDTDEGSDDDEEDERAAMLATLEAHQMSLLGGALPFASTSGSSNGRAKEVKEAKSVWEMDDADFDDEEDSEDDEDDEEEGEDEGDERAQSASKAATVVAFVEPGRESSNLAVAPSAPMSKREIRDFKAGKVKNLHAKRSIADEHNVKYVGGAAARKKAALAAGDAKGAATAEKEAEDQVEENHLTKLDSHLASLVKPLTSGTGSSSLPDLLRELPLEPTKAGACRDQLNALRCSSTLSYQSTHPVSPTMASYASSTADSTSTGTTDEMNEPLSILQPLSYSANSCGYCAEVKGARSRAKSSKSYGAWAHALSAGTYKALLDRGWRRSGCYMYKPDMRNTCCPHLDAGSFKPSRSQRQVLARFNAFVKTGERDGQPGWGTQASQEASTSGTSRTAAAAEKGGNDVAMGEAVPAKKKDKGRGKGKANQAEAADWGESVHAGDWDRSPQDEPFKHRFEFTLEPASYTDEKFQLFKRYQMEVHEEPASKVSEKGFRRFLVDTPLDIEPTASPDHSYGSHHGLWRLDGRLIAFAVLDLLPGAVSSVYFVWDPDYSGMSLGKLSALREAQMVREMEKAGLWSEGSGRYMMGFYIHTCPKMRYKADYQPSFLLEPDTNRYVPWAQCKPLLDLSSRILSFTDPPPPASSVAAATTSAHPVAPPTPPPEDASMAHLDDEMDEDDEAAYPSPPPPGCLDPHELPKDLLIESFVLEKRTLMPLLLSSAWHDPVTQIEVRELLATTGDAGKGKLAIWTGR